MDGLHGAFFVCSFSALFFILELWNFHVSTIVTLTGNPLNECWKSYSDDLAYFIHNLPEYHACEDMCKRCTRLQVCVHRLQVPTIYASIIRADFDFIIKFSFWLRHLASKIQPSNTLKQQPTILWHCFRARHSFIVTFMFNFLFFLHSVLLVQFTSIVVIPISEILVSHFNVCCSVISVVSAPFLQESTSFFVLAIVFQYE